MEEGLGLFYISLHKVSQNCVDKSWIGYILCCAVSLCDYDHRQVPGREGRRAGRQQERSEAEIFSLSQCAAAPIVCVVLAARPVSPAGHSTYLYLSTLHTISPYDITDTLISTHDIMHYLYILKLL